jgi:hypothetical protein
LTPEDRQELERIRAPRSPEREALAALAGVELPEGVSEAVVLHALVVAGRAAIADELMDAGYAELGASETDEDRGFERAMRARVRDRSAPGED